MRIYGNNWGVMSLTLAKARVINWGKRTAGKIVRNPYDFTKANGEKIDVEFGETLKNPPVSSIRRLIEYALLKQSEISEKGPMFLGPLKTLKLEIREEAGKRTIVVSKLEYPLLLAKIFRIQKFIESQNQRISGLKSQIINLSVEIERKAQKSSQTRNELENNSFKFGRLLDQIIHDVNNFLQSLAFAIFFSDERLTEDNKSEYISHITNAGSLTSSFLRKVSCALKGGVFIFDGEDKGHDYKVLKGLGNKAKEEVEKRRFDANNGI